MAPLDPNKSPKPHIPTLNHIGLWVDDLKVAVEHLTKTYRPSRPPLLLCAAFVTPFSFVWMHSGVRFAPGGIRKGAAGFDVAFIHPKVIPASRGLDLDCSAHRPLSFFCQGNEQFPLSGEGVLLELVQAPPEVIAANPAK